jgi:positive phototaxis protein PixI
MAVDLRSHQQISQFFSFYLTSQIQVMLPASQISEILNLEAGQIVPIFDVPPAMMGVCNRRGEVLWILDLAYLMGLEPLFTQNSRYLYSIMVIRQQEKLLGLAVRQMGQLVVCNQAQIQPTPLNQVSPQLAFCLKGEKRNPDRQVILVLDGNKIFDLLNK